MKKIRDKNKTKAFTLIELLVVIAIIGILATISVVSINNTRSRSRDSRRVSDIKQVHTALELYYDSANEYPDELIAGNALEHNGIIFLNRIPSAPTPADGNCDNDNNLYQYIKINPSDYALYYCLGNSIGQLKEGSGYASPINLQTSLISQGVVVSFTDVGLHIWNVPTGVYNIDVLVVAGGGGGGSSVMSSGGGGGGGAGGLIYKSNYHVIPNQEINVFVGDGGAPGSAGRQENGANGENSSFGSLVAIGGGGGANNFSSGLAGGSGGGAGYNGYSTIRYGGEGIMNQGNFGGNTSELSWAGGAGGGGAGGVGGSNKINHAGGDPGPGLIISISGFPVTYAEGGSGGSNSPGLSPANKGYGGDAAYATGVAYAGGSGVVIIRY